MSILRGADDRLRAGWRFLLAVIIAVLANLAAGFLAVPLLRVHPLAFESLARPLALLFLLLGFSSMLRVWDRVPQDNLAHMGLGFRRRWLRESLVGAAVGTLMIAAAVAGVALLGDVTFSFRFSAAALGVAAAWLWILVTAAIVEEVMFRGYPFQRLTEAAGAPLAILVFSVLFGLAHIANPNASAFGLINTVLVGVVFALAYLRTRALWLPWGIHFGWNFALGVVFGLPVSGLDMSSLVRGRAEGPLWLTGGAYGLEASAPASLVIVAAIAAVVRLTPAAAPAKVPDMESAPAPADSIQPG